MIKSLPQVYTPMTQKCQVDTQDDLRNKIGSCQITIYCNESQLNFLMLFSRGSTYALNDSLYTNASLWNIPSPQICEIPCNGRNCLAFAAAINLNVYLITYT